MKIYTVIVSDRGAKIIDEVISDMSDPGLNKPMTVERLLEYLLDDIALTYTRPGSWEGSNMDRVLQSHGFYI